MSDQETDPQVGPWLADVEPGSLPDHSSEGNKSREGIPSDSNSSDTDSSQAESVTQESYTNLITNNQRC